MTLALVSDWPRWEKAVADLLASNQVTVGTHRYTRPAPSTYEHQWLWDSCFHAITYRWFDPEMARAELLSAVAHQVETGPDTGMLPHMTYWRGGGEDLWGLPNRSLITQPPLVGVAARLVFQVTHDRELLVELYPHLTAYHEWFERRRDPDGDDLVSLIHPWESGWDSSPRWDRAMNLPRYFSNEYGSTTRQTLAKRLPQYGCDPVALAQAGLYHVEAVDYNATRAADLEALVFIAQELGQPAEAARWQARAQAVQAAVQKKMLQPWPHDLDGLDEATPTEECASEFIVLFGGCISPADAGRLVDHLRVPEIWTPFPVPTSPTGAATFAPDQYWRGNSWLVVNWMIYMGLRRYGYFDLASELALKSLQLVEGSGFWEYYHPITGRGLGAHPQSWSGLVLDMLAGESGRGI